MRNNRAKADPNDLQSLLRSLPSIGQRRTSSVMRYIVNFSIYKQHFCDGAIINSQWTITAASCFAYGLPHALMEVRSGSEYATFGGTIHVIEKPIIHQNFTRTETNMTLHNIALVRVYPSFDDAPHTIPIIMFAAWETVKETSLAFLVGWGWVNSNTLQSTDELNKKKVRLMTKKKCDELREDTDRLADDQVCIEHLDKKHKDCNIDPGGLLVIGEQLYGISSWGFDGRATAYLNNLPETFTKVSVYREWVREQIDV